MSRVVLEGLEFHARHGVYETEAALGARFVIDAELHWAFAGIPDELGSAVNYAAADSYSLLSGQSVVQALDLGGREQIITPKYRSQ